MTWDFFFMASINYIQQNNLLHDANHNVKVESEPISEQEKIMGVIIVFDGWILKWGLLWMSWC